MQLVTLGEILIDFLQVERQGELPAFVAQPGGAPANVACAAAKLGIESAFVGKVGVDQFGKQLVSALQQHHVQTQHVLETVEYPTTLAFVHVDTVGDRSFSFYRNGSADVQLTIEDIRQIDFSSCRIFHFGSNSCTTEESKAATFKAFRRAKQHGAIISYDPNIRPKLWQQETDMLRAIEEVLSFVDVLKLSEEELLLLTGNNLRDGIEQLQQRYAIPLVVVTLGAQGVMYRYEQQIHTIAGHDVAAIDTTGAGDAFVGAMLARLMTYDEPFAVLPLQELHDLLSFANAAAALSTTKNGAIPSLPTNEQINAFLQRT